MGSTLRTIALAIFVLVVGFFPPDLDALAAASSATALRLREAILQRIASHGLPLVEGSLRSGDRTCLRHALDSLLPQPSSPWWVTHYKIVRSSHLSRQSIVCACELTSRRTRPQVMLSWSWLLWVSSGEVAAVLARAFSHRCARAFSFFLKSRSSES